MPGRIASIFLSNSWSQCYHVNRLRQNFCCFDHRLRLSRPKYCQTCNDNHPSKDRHPTPVINRCMWLCTQICQNTVFQSLAWRNLHVLSQPLVQPVVYYPSFIVCCHDSSPITLSSSPVKSVALETV